MRKLKRRGRNVVALGCVLAWMLLAWGPRARALDPSLDIRQYAHTAWKVRDGVFKGTIRAIAQTPDGYLWLGTEFGLVRFDGVKAVPWQPAGHFGLPGMRERAENVGGRLEVRSRVESGTEVELSIPGDIAYGRSARRSWFSRVLPGNSRDHGNTDP